MCISICEAEDSVWIVSYCKFTFHSAYTHQRNDEERRVIKFQLQDTRELLRPVGLEVQIITSSWVTNRLWFVSQKSIDGRLLKMEEEKEYRNFFGGYEVQMHEVAFHAA